MRKQAKKPRRKPSLIVVVLVLCNLFQAGVLAYNFVVLEYQRDQIRYLFQHEFEKEQ